ncbi:MAG: CDP-diacylglycerol--glycerol-3-phosphate 3-phosphatidyltransferase [Thermoguttaceae bacterium]|jgi:CDP-diacylglycerol--glycerol-3-phosphate 3-phosphatidyltransferase
MSIPAESAKLSRRAARARRMWATAFNLPNQLTTARLILAVIMFGLIAWEHYTASTVLFIIAAGTDWLDGYFARKYNQVTNLGRILDPFADKVIVCGTFIFLIAIPQTLATPWGLRPWMVVAIVGRELLVTALRSFIEDRGSDFSAQWSGKVKMVLQCLSAVVCLVFLELAKASVSDAPEWLWLLLVASVWSTVIVTVYSGLVYVLAAIRLMRGQ